MSLQKELYVLLAEDNFAEVNLFQIALREAHLQAPLKIVNTGLEVLDFLNARGAYSHRDPLHYPSLLILDLNLPLLDGFEVLTMLRMDERFKDLPIVIFTSSERYKDSREAKNRGATEFFQKPIDFYDFVKSVTRMYERWVK
ncbi:MAG: response regulator [Bacteroidia bacterium]|nr:response regulator [Bacteroidia bacterium]